MCRGRRISAGPVGVICGLLPLDNIDNEQAVSACHHPVRCTAACLDEKAAKLFS